MSLEESAKKGLLMAGNQHRYQMMIMYLLYIIFYFNLFLFLGPSFYFMDPTFQCKGQKSLLNEAEACHRIDQCTVSNGFTITAKLGLYCQKEYQRNMVQSLLSAGSLLGLFVMNIVSDLKGRRTALLIDLVIAVTSIALTILGACMGSITLLILSSIMSGFSGSSLVIVAYIIAADICEQQLRQKSSLYMNLSNSLALITFCFLYNWLNQWYNVLIFFMLIPFTILNITTYFLLKESPNYYLCKIKDKQRCADVLVDIARINGKEEDVVQDIRMLIGAAEESVEEYADDVMNRSFFTVLRDWRYFRIILFVAITEAGGNLLFYGIEYAIDDIGYNYGVDNLVLGITQVLVTHTATKYISKLPRKKTSIISNLGAACISFIFLIQSMEQSKFLSTVLIILIRIFSTIAYFMIVMFQTQSFPLKVKSIGAGAIQAFSQFGAILAPLIISFAVHFRLEKMAALGFVLLFCIIPIYFVPEPSGTRPSRASRGSTKSQLVERMLELKKLPSKKLYSAKQ